MKQIYLSNMMISDLCQQLALLLKAGVRLSDGLFMLADDIKDASYSTLLSNMAQEVEEGMLLSDAFANANCFPVHVSGLLNVGERVGRTEETLVALAHYYEEQERTKRQLKNALTYPAILFAMMLIVIVVLLTKVLPVFDEVYASLGGSLTGLAGGLLSIGNFLNKIMPFLGILLLLIIVAILLFANIPSLRKKVIRLWNRHFGDQGISKKMNEARFAQALSMAYTSGLPLEEGITLAASLLADCPKAYKRCETCRSLLDEGNDLAQSLEETGIFSSSACRILTLGMRAGTGDTALEEVARRLTDEAREALESTVAKVEPALVLFTSILVGAILLSVMLPLMHIMKAIG